MSELNIGKASEKPKKETYTLSPDNLEKDINEIFDELGESGEDKNFEFKERRTEITPESAENIFLAENPDVRKVIEATNDTSVEFEGVNDEIADKVKKIVRKNLDIKHVLLGLNGEILAEAEAEKNRIFSEEDLTKLSEDEIEDAAKKLFKKIEVAVTEIELKHASTH